MRMISVLKLIPLRNETGAIYKWQEEANLISPLIVQRARLEPNLDHVVVHLTNGEQIVVEDTLKTFDKKFDEATS
jgi:hypothetical protein